jgi:hypothetical protein
MSSIARLARASFCASRARNTTFVLGLVLGIEERIAADRNLGVGPGDLAELHPDVALARRRPDTFLRTRSQSRKHAGGDGQKKERCPSQGRGGGLSLQNLYFFLQNQYNPPWQKEAVNRGQNWLFNRSNRLLSGRL